MSAFIRYHFQQVKYYTNINTLSLHALLKTYISESVDTEKKREKEETFVMHEDSCERVPLLPATPRVLLFSMTCPLVSSGVEAGRVYDIIFVDCDSLGSPVLCEAISLVYGFQLSFLFIVSYACGSPSDLHSVQGSPWKVIMNLAAACLC